MSAKEILSKLTETYGRLEEQQREPNELEARVLGGGSSASRRASGHASSHASARFASIRRRRAVRARLRRRWAMHAASRRSSRWRTGEQGRGR